jgi:hypothetical protein
VPADEEVAEPTVVPEHPVEELDAPVPETVTPAEVCTLDLSFPSRNIN